MSDVIASLEAHEDGRPVELPADVLDEQLIGQLVDRARAGGLQLTGEGGLLQQLTKRAPLTHTNPVTPVAGQTRLRPPRPRHTPSLPL